MNSLASPQTAIELPRLAPTEGITLDNVRPGRMVVVSAVHAPTELRSRLEELGLVPGTSIRVLGRMPWGGAVAIEVRGGKLALRRQDARSVEVVG